MVTRPGASSYMGSLASGGSLNSVPGASVTGAHQGADRLIEKVSQVGFRSVHLPVLTTSRLPLTQSLYEAITRLGAGRYTWLVLLSPTAVYACKEAWIEVCGDGVFPIVTKVALQGPGTAEAFKNCFSRAPDLVPEQFLAEELAGTLSNSIVTSGSPAEVSVLLLQARDGRNVVAPIVATTGASVECYPLYATEEVPLPEETIASLAEIPEGEMVLIFMSPSAVRVTDKYLEDRHRRASSVLCVGPVTAQAAKQCGYKKIIESKDHSEEGIVNLLRTTFGMA